MVWSQFNFIFTQALFFLGLLSLSAIQNKHVLFLEIWLDYIKAETNYGSPEKVGSINQRAIKALEGSHNQEFLTQFTLMQNSGRI